MGKLICRSIMQGLPFILFAIWAIYAQAEEVCETNNNKAYTFVSDRANFKDAEEYCNQLPNGHLASIHNERERDFIYQLIERNGDEQFVWIGLNDRALESEFRWTDGSTINYVHWENGEPNNEPQGLGDGVFIKNDPILGVREWKDGDPSMLYKWVCKSDACRDGRVPDPCETAAKHDKKYFVVVDQARDYYEAEAICGMMDGHLASIHNKQEQTFIQDLLAHYSNLDEVAFGLNEMTAGNNWRWLDNSDVTYFNWANNQPDLSRNVGRVAVLSKAAGYQWADVGSHSGKRAFVCSSYICPSPIDIPADGDGHPCPLAKRFGDRYFILMREKRNYAEANSRCIEMGGYLASVHNIPESDYLKQYIQTGGDYQDVIIGGYKSAGVFKWSDKTPWDFAAWAAMEPNQGKMITISKLSNEPDGRGWKATDKEERHPFICVSDQCPINIVPGRKDMCMCSCVGDPHCESFDGRRMHFMGGCLYVLSRDGCINGQIAESPNFMVVADMFRKDGVTKDVTWVYSTMVLFPKIGLEVKFVLGKSVFINGAEHFNFPYSPHPLVSIDKTSRNVKLVSAELGLLIKNADTNVDILVDNTMNRGFCGICGACDGNITGDAQIGPNNTCAENYENGMPLPGVSTEDDNMYGDSWMFDVDPADEMCLCKPPETPECTPEAEAEAKFICEALLHPLGPFQECMAKVPDVFNAVFEECWFDICSSGVVEEICQHGKSLVDMCVNEHQLVVLGWREIHNQCHLECPSNQHYEGCGEVCESSCYDPNKQNCNDPDVCEEGCFCNDGYVRHGDDCILLESCPTTPVPTPLPTLPPTTTVPTQAPTTTPEPTTPTPTTTPEPTTPTPATTPEPTTPTPTTTPEPTTTPAAITMLPTTELDVEKKGKSPTK